MKYIWQALSDVIESIVGAMYISDNFSPVGTEAIFDNVLKPFYDRHITLKTLSHHPTKILFELFQAQGCRQFQIIKEKHQGLTCCEGRSERSSRLRPRLDSHSQSSFTKSFWQVQQT